MSKNKKKSNTWYPFLFPNMNEPILTILTILRPIFGVFQSHLNAPSPFDTCICLPFFFWTSLSPSRNPQEKQKNKKTKKKRTKKSPYLGKRQLKIRRGTKFAGMHSMEEGGFGKRAESICHLIRLQQKPIRQQPCPPPYYLSSRRPQRELWE